MKILFVNASLTDGGSERAMTLVAQSLAANGHNVTMALIRDKPRTYPIDTRIKVVQLRYRASSRGLQLLIERLGALRALIRREGFDAVVSFMWDINITTVVAALGLRTRVVVSERAFPEAPGRSRLSRLIEAASYRHAHRIVYQTSGAQDHCPPHLRTRSVVVPNMIKPSSDTRIRSSRSRSIVSIGRLTPQKNFPLLIRSFAEFRQQYPDWELDIYGQGPQEENLRALVETLGLGDSVRFRGFVSDVAERIRDAGMFVLASDYEGISNAMTEAMAMGLPVVSTDCPVGGAALMIENRVSGMLVPVRDQKQLTKAMSEVAGDEQFAESLGLGAQASVARFRPEALVTLWEEVLK